MNNAVDMINLGRNISDIQLIRNVIASYTFIDYALVEEYNEGIITVTLAHTINNKPTTLTNIEVLCSGSKGFSTSYELVKGDIVQLYSSKSFIEMMSLFTTATERRTTPYDTSTIKAIPLSVKDQALNNLSIAADGSISLIGEHYTLTIGAGGAITLHSDKIIIQEGEKIHLNGSGKSFVTWSELNSVLAAHTHPAGLLIAPPSGGPVTGATGASANININAAKTTTVLTDG